MSSEEPSGSHSSAVGESPHSIESALSDALTLIESALSQHRDIGGQRSVVDLSDSQEVAAVTAQKLIAEAQHEIKCVSVPESLTGGPFRAVIDKLCEASLPALSVQILFHVRNADGYQQLRSLVSDHGHDVRFTGSALQEILLVDGRIAMVVAQFGPAVRQILIVRSPAILKTLHGLFTSSWMSATPITSPGGSPDTLLDRTTQQVLALLRDGYKDDVAARTLGMSVRTYRRHVADLMREINATSRFQAGVMVAELRVLPPIRHSARPPAGERVAARND